MQLTQEYYTAETQDIPITIYLNRKDSSGATIQFDTRIFSLTVVSDVIIRKQTATIATTVRNQSATGTLGYTPVMLTLARGGRIIPDPFALIASVIPSGWTAVNMPVYDATTILTGMPYVSGVTASPAGTILEVTTTISLYLAGPVFEIIALPD